MKIVISILIGCWYLLDTAAVVPQCLALLAQMLRVFLTLIGHIESIGFLKRALWKRWKQKAKLIDYKTSCNHFHDSRCRGRCENDTEKQGLIVFEKIRKILWWKICLVSFNSLIKIQHASNWSLFFSGASKLCTYFSKDLYSSHVFCSKIWQPSYMPAILVPSSLFEYIVA